MEPAGDPRTRAKPYPGRSAPQAHWRPFGELAAAMNALLDITSILRDAKGHRTP